MYNEFLVYMEKSRRRYHVRSKSTRKTTHGTTWQDNIKTWTETSLVEAMKATENCSQWRKIVDDAGEPRTAEED